MKISADREIHAVVLTVADLAGNFTAFTFLDSIAPVGDFIPFIPVEVTVLRPDRRTESDIFVLLFFFQRFPEERCAFFRFAVIMSAAGDMLGKGGMFHSDADGIAPFMNILVHPFQFIREKIVPVIAPFPDIAQHVIQSPFVRLLHADRTGFHAIAIPCDFVQIIFRFKTGAAGVFPLCFGRQEKFIPLRQLTAEFFIQFSAESSCLLPSNVFNRTVVTAFVLVCLVSHHILPLNAGDGKLPQPEPFRDRDLVFRLVGPAILVEFLFVSHDKGPGFHRHERDVHLVSERKCHFIAHNHLRVLRLEII